jgi:hypothetical protein
MKRLVFALALIVSLVFATSQASAVIIISNFPPANDNSGSTVASITDLFAKGAGFTMPAGLPYQLDSVTMRLTRNDVSATMVLNLFGDTGGNPVGPSLVSFVIPAFGLGTSDITFTPSASFTLLPSTTYWLAATGASPTADGIIWRASSPGITPTGVATSAGYRFSSVGTYPPTGGSSILNTYQINGTQVPEPSTLAIWSLLGALGITIGWWRRKRET